MRLLVGANLVGVVMSALEIRITDRSYRPEYSIRCAMIHTTNKWIWIRGRDAVASSKVSHAKPLTHLFATAALQKFTIPLLKLYLTRPHQSTQ